MGLRSPHPPSSRTSAQRIPEPTTALQGNTLQFFVVQSSKMMHLAPSLRGIVERIIALLQTVSGRTKSSRPSLHHRSSLPSTSSSRLRLQSPNVRSGERIPCSLVIRIFLQKFFFFRRPRRMSRATNYYVISVYFLKNGKCKPRVERNNFLLNFCYFE